MLAASEHRQNVREGNNMRQQHQFMSYVFICILLHMSIRFKILLHGEAPPTIPKALLPEHTKEVHLAGENGAATAECRGMFHSGTSRNMEGIL